MSDGDRRVTKPLTAGEGGGDRSLNTASSQVATRSPQEVDGFRVGRGNT